MISNINKLDVLLFSALFLFGILAIQQKNGSNALFSLFPCVVHEYQKKGFSSAITSISVENGSVKYLNSHEQYGSQKSKYVAYLVEHKSCKVIDNNNWSCGESYPTEMINGRFISRHDEGRVVYDKMIYWFGLRLFPI